MNEQFPQTTDQENITNPELSANDAINIAPPQEIPEPLEQEQKSGDPPTNKKTIIIGGVILAAIILIIALATGDSEFEKARSEALRIAGRVTGGSDDDYFAIDTYPDEYDNMDPMVVLMLEDNTREDALEAIKYANKALGFDGVYSEMLETTALMGRQSEENDKYKVSWTYHPDDGLEVTYRKK